MHGINKVTNTDICVFLTHNCIIRQGKNLFNGCKVAKLFAKHLKVPEQVQYLKQNTVDLAVGTPNRLYKLQEECDLFGECELVVLDGYRDAKQRTLLTMPECKQDFFRLIKDFCLPRLTGGKMFISHY